MSAPAMRRDEAGIAGLSNFRDVGGVPVGVASRVRPGSSEITGAIEAAL